MLEFFVYKTLPLQDGVFCILVGILNAGFFVLSYTWVLVYLYLLMYSLGTFAKLRIATVSFVTSVLSVCPRDTTGIPTGRNFYET